MPKEQGQLEVKVGLSLEELISAINALDKSEREFLMENLLAATSPGYLKSIEEAREDYRQGRVLSPEEIFNKVKG